MAQPLFASISFNCHVFNSFSVYLQVNCISYKIICQARQCRLCLVMLGDSYTLGFAGW